MWIPGWKLNYWRKADGKPVENKEKLIELDQAMSAMQTIDWV